MTKPEQTNTEYRASVQDCVSRYSHGKKQPNYMWNDIVNAYLSTTQSMDGQPYKTTGFTGEEIKKISKELCKKMGSCLQKVLRISDEEFERFIDQKTHSGKRTSLGLLTESFFGTHEDELAYDIFTTDGKYKEQGKELGAKEFSKEVLQDSLIRYKSGADDAALADVKNDQHINDMIRYIGENASKTSEPINYKLKDSDKDSLKTVFKMFKKLVNELYGNKEFGNGMNIVNLEDIMLN